MRRHFVHLDQGLPGLDRVTNPYVPAQADAVVDAFLLALAAAAQINHSHPDFITVDRVQHRVTRRRHAGHARRQFEAKIVGCTPQAKALGIEVGMSGKEAVELMLQAKLD